MNVRHLALLFLFSAPILLGPMIARADMMPPGHTSIDWLVIVNGADRFPEWRFYIYPTGTSFDEAESLDPSEDGRLRTHFYQASSPYLYAVPKTREVQAVDLLLPGPSCERECKDAAPPELDCERHCQGDASSALQARGIARSPAPLTFESVAPIQGGWAESHSIYELVSIAEGVIEANHHMERRTKSALEEAAKAREAEIEALRAAQIAELELAEKAVRYRRIGAVVLGALLAALAAWLVNRRR